MRCPICSSTDVTCVLNTVHREDGVVRRRRGCRHCQVRWTTLESYEPGTLIRAFVPRPAVGDDGTPTEAGDDPVPVGEAPTTRSCPKG